MRLVDTSAWVEWLTGSKTGKTVESQLPVQESWLVPTIVQLELMKWLTREADEERADQVLAFTELCVVVSLDTRIALLAAEMCRPHKLATADAIVYATARIHDADFLTCDARFRALPGVCFIQKPVKG